MAGKLTEAGQAYIARAEGGATSTVLFEITVTSRHTWDYAKGF